MPTFITFSASDRLRNKIVEPAWYTLDIQGHRTWSPTKDGQSNNCYFECIVERNADNGSTEFAGVPIELMFNDKVRARGFIEGFLKSLGVDIQDDARYDISQAVGKKVEAFIENETFDGRIRNRCNHKYRPVRS